MNILNSIQQIFTRLFLYVFRLVSYEVRKLRFVGKDIPVEDKIEDFYEIFSSTWVFFIFNLLALFVFMVLPQGKDVILLVIEDLSKFRPGSLVSLLIGLIIWSIFSEFGARYKIYVTDNSGVALTAERVNFRKEAQRFVSSIYLLLPVFIVIASTVVVSVTNIREWELNVIWPFIILLALLILTFAGLSKFYLDELYVEKIRNDGVWYKVNLKELAWANKLYGIYNDHVFMIRKTENFRDDAPDPVLKQTYQRFISILENLPLAKSHTESSSIESFPRDYITDQELAPEEFKKVKYSSTDSKLVFSKDQFKHVPRTDGFYRWIYKNEPSFFKTLHLQVHIIAISSVVFIFLIATRFLIPYEFIGSPALVCLSFGCWVGVYTGLFYIDTRFRRKLKVSVRLFLFIWFLVVSFIDRDHPVRINGDTGFSNERLSLSKHFTRWIKERVPDTLKKNTAFKDSTASKDSTATPVPKYPVYFITAEGGALRTGAFTAMLLASIQDSFKTFKDHIYAFSTVSGGSVGISFFNAVNYLEPDTNARIRNYNQLVTRKFFSKDQLSPVLAKLFYADILQYFWPWHITNFDRAIALEKAWEKSYASVFNETGDENAYSKNFLDFYQKYDSGKTKPAWFINTTEVETGLQCFITNVSVQSDSFLFARNRDLLASKIRGGINYSTAVNFSSRFPLFSPSAALYQNDEQTYHYVDGGYVENTGAKTMLEVLQILDAQIRDSSSKRFRIIPYVIQLKFGDSTHFEKTGFLNEVTSIFSGIYNTRAGSSATYTAFLKDKVKNLGGDIVQVPLTATSQEVPMSWAFSARSLSNVDSAVREVMADTLNELHTKLPCFRLDSSFVK